MKIGIVHVNDYPDSIRDSIRTEISDSQVPSYKLQDCKTLKILKSWVHANRLKLYEDDRDKIYTRHYSPNPENQVSPFTPLAQSADTASQRRRDKCFVGCRDYSDAL